MMNFKNNKNYLILIGGAEDRRDKKTVLRTVVEKAKAKHVVLIPTASFYPREVSNTYSNAFRDLGVEKYDCLDIRYNDEADHREHLEIIEKADLLFFSGGDQVKLVNTLDNSKLLERIKHRFFYENLTIAGTSAGAASASSPMTYDGDYEGFKKDTVKFSKGFGFLPDVTVDTHFTARNRIPRLTQFLLTGQSTRGIGIDEDTGIVISPNLRFEVIGSGVVTVINTDKVTYSDYDTIRNDDLYTANNVRIGFLSPGTAFSMKRWSVLKPSERKKKVLESVAKSYY